MRLRSASILPGFEPIWARTNCTIYRCEGEWTMDLVLKNARLPGRGDALADIAMSSGKIAVIDQNIATGGPVIDAGGRLVAPGFIETHIHLDKSCILDRCNSTRGDLEEAIGEAAKAKASFTPEDVHRRATRTLEKAILQGTTHMRTHLEVDPGVGLGVLPLVRDYACEYLPGRQEG